MKTSLFKSAALAALLIARSALGATWYIDFAAGSDSNAGTSEGAAFKRCPGDPSATGTAASTTLSPGDTVRFKGGVSYIGQIRNTAGNGSFGSPIIYEGGAPTGWGTGYAIIDGTGISAASWTATYRGLINLPHFSVARELLVTNASPNNAAYGLVYNAGSFITISNCATGLGGAGAAGGNGFIIYRGSGASGTNYVYENCYAQSNAWHGFFAVGTLTNVFYTNCHASWNGNQTGTYADGWFIGDNSFGYPNNVVVSQCTADNHPQKGGMIFEPPFNALLDRCTVTGTNAFGVAVINTQYSTDIATNMTIRNCVVDVDTAVSGAPIQIKASNNSFDNGIRSVYLLNNTFRIRKGANNTAVVWAQTQANTFIEGLFATNNIICTGSNSVTLVNLNARTTNTFFDYNLYWTNVPARVNVEFVTNGTNTTPVNWWPQQDPNATLRRLTNSAGLDASLYPLNGSPVIDEGTSVNFGNDLVGTTRPQGAKVDIGAYEFIQSFSSILSAIATAGAVVPMKVDPFVEPHNHPASPLLFENFESAGYTTAGWEDYLNGTGNSINPDNTTNVLSGGQSLAIVGVSDDPTFATNSFAASSEVYGYFQFQCLKYPSEDGDAYRQVMRLETEDGTTLFHLLMFNTGTLYIQTGATSDGALAGPLTLGQTYHVWWSWNKNNGSNSEATLAYSTSKVKPTSGDTFVSITGNTIADDATRIMVGYDNTPSELDATLGGLFNGAPSWIYDYVILDDVEIPSYP